MSHSSWNAKSSGPIRSLTVNKASGGDGISAELFQILKDDAVKVLHSLCQQIWQTQQWPLDWKRSVSIPIPKIGNERNERKVMPKKYSNYHTISLILHASKIILTLQARLQHYVNQELQMYKLDLGKAEETENRLPTSAGSQKKQGNSRKTSISASLTMLKPLTV